MPNFTPNSAGQPTTPAHQPSPLTAEGPAAGVPRRGQRFNPVANPESVHVIPGGNTRLTFLTDRILRVEWSPDGRFEDRASFAFVNRNLPPANLDGMEMGGTVGCTNGTFSVFYPASGSKQFAIDKIIIRRPGQVGNPDAALVEWTPGTRPSRNLKGTVRTLDGVSGACELDDGLLTRDGWTWIDDSKTLLFDTSGTDWPWATPRRHPEAIDWYFFAYGDDYRGMLNDFTKVAGKIPLPPKYALGSWWSRYWAYTDDELKGIVRQFDEHDVPLDVLVIDMDWHLDGWTGYTWNKDYFPDPAAFLKWCKDNRLFVTLNLHPADGVGKHEAQFPAFKAAMGITDKTCYRIPFDCTDRRYVENYFALLHHPEEDRGVDFWWMDWQQGTNTKIAGLDPLFWLNYLHWTDFERRSNQGLSLPGTAWTQPGWKPTPPTPGSYGDKRPLIFSRWGGLGNHRYQIGFSGDTYNNWESLAFQPSFTATASNVGYAYWSHDIGGHQPGPVEPELYARWIQFGVFSPILRTHCGKRPDAERRIWAFPDHVFRVCREAFHLRYALIPYIYTACRHAYDTGMGLCRPLYYHWPTLDNAYQNHDQYMFGDDLMVAPVVSPANDVSGVASADVWFPPVDGGWTDWATGKVHAESHGAPPDDRAGGGTTTRLSYALRDIPVFARSGAVIPMQPRMRRTGEKPVDPLILTIYDAGPNGARSGSGRVYEDDGITSGYERGEFSVTKVSHTLRSGALGWMRSVEISPAEGAYEGMPQERAYELRLPFTLPPWRGLVLVQGAELNERRDPRADDEPGWWYDARAATLHVRTPKLPVSRAVVIDVALSKQDDAPIRRGLIGQLILIDDVLALLGPAAPESLRAAAALRAELASDPASAMSRAAALQRDWWTLIDDIAAGPAPAELKQRAQARLLGLSCDIGVKGLGAGRIGVEARVAFAPRFDHADDAHVHVAFESNPAGAWSLTAHSSPPAKLAMGKGLTASAVLASSNVPGAGELATRVTIEARGTRITMASTRSFCPSINQWHVLGPFDASQAGERALSLAPIDETKPVDLNAAHPSTIESVVGPIRWKKISRRLDPNDDPCKELFVDLHTAFGAHHDDALAYAVTWVECPVATKAVMALGSDDGAAVWVNGQEFFRKDVQRGYNAKDDRFPIALKAGRNEILLKISQMKGAWGFGAFIEDEHGNPLPGLRVVD